MDDFNVSSLHESRNEWSARLITVLTPLIIGGYQSILEDAIKLCKATKEMDKYLMTFQNLISRVPKWNQAIIEKERKRICEKSGCLYLEDLVTCVHIIQLKILTAMRVGQKQKKIDINIPKLDDFIHKAYIGVARKIYKNTYLFEQHIPALQKQKYQREIEIIVQEGILNTIRESIPVEAILRAYMDETVEEDVIEEIKEQEIKETEKEYKTQLGRGTEQVIEERPPMDIIDTMDNTTLRFSDQDSFVDTSNQVGTINAPKDFDTLEQKSISGFQQRKAEAEDDDDEEDGGRLNISDNAVSLDSLDIHVIDELPKVPKELFPELIMDVVVLDDI
jgi:hypothetical protein